MTRRTVLTTLMLLGCCGIPLLGVGLFLKGCVEPKITEVQRVHGPSGTVDAVVLSDYYDEGATGFHEDFRVLLVPRGKPAEENGGNLVLTASDIEGYDTEGTWRPEWKSIDKLSLRFRSAHVTQYDNVPWSIGSGFVGVRLEVALYGGHEHDGGQPISQGTVRAESTFPHVPLPDGSHFRSSKEAHFH